jgi:flagellar protein FlaJ
MKKAEKVGPSSEFSFAGFSYQYFGWMGLALKKAFYGGSGLEEAMEDAGIRIYPDAYYSIVGLFFLIGLIVVLPVAFFTSFLFIIPAPFLIVFLGYAVPQVMTRDRASKLDLEVPFAGAYVSVMATGGLSPYASLKRLKACQLLPSMSKVIGDIETDVEIKGLDPATAMEESARTLPSRDYKDLILGYASTVRTGGDVVHYLIVRTETMFKDLAQKVKAFGDRASLLMETYVTMSILMTLTLVILFMTSLSFQSFWGGEVTPDTFLIYAYFMVPLLALLFLFISDTQQISQPLNESGPYKIFLAASPIFIFLLLTMYLPFAAPALTLPFAPPFMDAIKWLRDTMGLSVGYESGLGMAVALIAAAIPGVIAHSYYIRRGKRIEREVTNFMRDLTETRKTGASPEKCMETLTGRNYGAFTQILNVATKQIQWGFPFKVIYETVKSKINSWIALMDIYLLVDAIEVGGGTPETLETLTHFSEELSSLEKEKQESMRPLIIMPYVGAGILVVSTLILLGFSQLILISYAHQSMPFSQVVTLILPPLMLQIFFTGIVTGKLSAGSASAGFKHALILVIIGLILVPITATLILPYVGGTA